MRNASVLMKQFRTLALSPAKPYSLFFSSSSSPENASPPLPPSDTAERKTTVALSEEEVTKINLLIPRLCESNHLHEAIRLVAAALLTNPPLQTLSLSVLIDRLASQPDLAQPMSLLNRLKHAPLSHPALLPISHMLLSSFFRKRRPKEALKVFNWISRPDSPCPPDAATFALMVEGLCGRALLLEALRVLRAMLAAKFVPGKELRTRVYRGLLREARIGEAKELNEALGSAAASADDGIVGVRKALELLDRLIANWVD